VPRQKISNAEFERKLAGQIDPVGKLSSGFPSTHSRIPSTLSTFVVTEAEAVTEEGLEEDLPDEEELMAARECVSRNRVA